MWGLTSSDNKGIGGGRNQSPGLMSSIFVEGRNSSGGERLVMYREIGQINKYVYDNGSYVSHC